jgi:ferredoxin
MANREERWTDNVAGPWYVDKNCILCSLCEELAPKIFKQAESGDHDIVYKQPNTPEELKAAKESMDQCPVEAIGNDG